MWNKLKSHFNIERLFNKYTLIGVFIIGFIFRYVNNIDNLIARIFENEKLGDMIIGGIGTLVGLFFIHYKKGDK